MNTLPLPKSNVVKQRLIEAGIYHVRVGGPAIMELMQIIAEPVPAGTTKAGAKPAGSLKHVGILIRNGWVTLDHGSHTYKATEPGRAYAALVTDKGVLA